MMKNKLLVLLPLFLLTSCGSMSNMIVSPKLDHSATWDDNYYTYFDESLKEKEVTAVTLDKGTNKVFTSYDDANFKKVEPKQSEYVYGNDFDLVHGYGSNFKLSQYNEMIKNGFVSKLFDGQLFCNGDYEGARVQINENGFSSTFYHPLESASYLYLNFKSAVDFKRPQYSIGHHLDIIKLHITFYGESAVRYSYTLEDVPSNWGESYIFYGFSLEGLDIKGATHFSISYDLIHDEVKEVEPSLNHALLLYEFGFGNPVFK